MKQSKQQIYDRIMRKVAPIVKQVINEKYSTVVSSRQHRAINELSSDLYNKASQKQSQYLNDDDFILAHTPAELNRFDQRRKSFDNAAELARQKELEKARRDAEEKTNIDKWERRKNAIRQRRAEELQRQQDLDKTQKIREVLNNILKKVTKLMQDKFALEVQTLVQNILQKDINEVTQDEWIKLWRLSGREDPYSNMYTPWYNARNYENEDIWYDYDDENNKMYLTCDGCKFVGICNSINLCCGDINGVHIDAEHDEVTCTFKDGSIAYFNMDAIEQWRNLQENRYCDEQRNIADEGIKKIFTKIAKTYKYQINFDWSGNLKYFGDLYDTMQAGLSADDRDIPWIVLSKNKKNLKNVCDIINNDPYNDGDYEADPDNIESTNIQSLIHFFYNEHGKIRTKF